jgi:hypothetical protein
MVKACAGREMQTTPPQALCTPQPNNLGEREMLEEERNEPILLAEILHIKTDLMGVKSKDFTS